MLLNDVAGRHVGSERIHMSSLTGDIHTRDIVNRSLAHSAAPSPVPSVFEPIQRPPTVMNYNFGEYLTLLFHYTGVILCCCCLMLVPAATE